uniref:hypothetical protein n=1 Tax=Cellulomonas citrea TaxID=1909423 RepID=UPI00135C3F2E
MKDDDTKLSGALQENLLTLLCFDDRYCKPARAVLTPQLFESAVFREVAGHAIAFIDQFGAPIKEHLPDHLEHILEAGDKKAASFRKLVENLFLAKDSINAEWVMTQLHKFVRQQTLKSAFLTAVEAFEAGDVDAAEVALQGG